MKRSSKAFLLLCVVWPISAYFADKTDWFTNLTPPAHMALAIWFGIASVVFGLWGIVMVFFWLIELFPDTTPKTNNRRGYDY